MTVAFAVFYLNLSARDPDAFSEPLGRTAALYFTMTTLTTVGYGDITARTDAARIAVMVQFLFNVAVIGTTAQAHRRHGPPVGRSSGAVSRVAAAGCRRSADR